MEKVRKFEPEEKIEVAAGGRSMNKWIYILLALCLGGLGLHNFYAGHTTLGVIWLVLFGLGLFLSFVGIGMLLIILLWLVAVVQAVIALCKRSDADGNIAV